MFINRSIKPKLGSLTLAISGVLLLGASQAEAAPTPPPPLLTFSNFSFTSFNTTTLNKSAEDLTSGDYNSGSSVNWSSTDIDFSSVEKPAKVGVPGSLSIYKDITTTTNTTDYSYFTDNASYSVAGSTGYSGNKWIQITGTVFALQDTTFSLQASANGSYLSTQIPAIGNVTPALPSFFYSFDSISADPSYVSSTAYLGSYSSSASDVEKQLTAGSSTSFSAIVFAGEGVSLSNFGLSVYGNDSYGYSSHDTTNVSTVSTLFKTIEIPALPAPVTSVPEPEEWAMMMLGLPLMGFVAHRRKSNDSKSFQAVTA